MSGKGRRKYKITLNWKGEVHIFYRVAGTPLQAENYAFKELARMLKVKTSTVSNFFWCGDLDNYKSEEVPGDDER